MADTNELMRLAGIQEQEALNVRESNNTSGGIPIPGGRLVPLEAFHGLEEMPTRNDIRYLAEPEKYLIKPEALKPGKYVWAAYDEKYGGDTTSGAIRSKRYRPVLPDELRDDVDFDVHFKTHSGTTKYVHWRDLILCHMTPQRASQQYDVPVAMYLRQMGVLQDAFKSEVASKSGGLAVGVATQTLSQG
jgi:hypothetical protein